jgi:hypothetical protein
VKKAIVRKTKSKKNVREDELIAIKTGVLKLKIKKM